MDALEAKSTVECPEFEEEAFEDTVAGESLSYSALWCWQHPGPDGQLMVVPLTDKAPPPELELRPQADELACAPQAAPPGSYAPPWTYGPCWPFNAAPTTLQLRGLPSDLAQEDLIMVLDREGFSGYYDFVHMASDLQSGLGLGRALVNFTRHEYGLTLAARLHGRQTIGGCGDNVPERGCEVTWSIQPQGLAELVAAHQKGPENHPDVPEEMRPQRFSKGWPMPFPQQSAKA